MSRRVIRASAVRYDLNRRVELADGVTGSVTGALGIAAGRIRAAR